MPPQNDNQVPPVAPVPPTAAPQPQSAPQQSAPSPFAADALMKNKKFVDTVKNFAIYGTIMSIINAVAGMIIFAFHFSGYYYGGFNVFSLVGTVIGGLIGLGLGGVGFYFLYEPIKGFVKRTPFLAQHINSMFTLLWKPFLLGLIINAFFAFLNLMHFSGIVMFGFGGLFIGWAVLLVVQAAAYYWYAKTVSAKLQSYYPW